MPSAEQLGSGALVPTQVSHGSQALKQFFTGVHGWHAVGSVTVVALQLPAPSRVEAMDTKRPLRAGSSQQPKQSQPLGVSGKQ